MSEIVLRLRLVGGEHLDVTYDEPETDDVSDVLEHAISRFSQDSGALQCRHGDRTVVVFGRAVAAVEVAPRGAVL